MLRRFVGTGTLAAVFLLCVAAAGSSQTVDRVIHISVDGLNVAMLQSLLDESPGSVPGFGRLVAEGAYTFNARTDYDYTTTVPNHTSMITGRPVMQPEGQPDTVHHGMTSNSPGPNATIHSIGNPVLGYIPSVFDVVHDRGLGTAFFASKTRLAAFVARSYDGQYGALDLIGADDGRDKTDIYYNHEDDSDDAVTKYLEAMTATPREYSFVHIVDPDYAGHGNGWESDNYRHAVLMTDERVNRILNYVSSDPDFAGRTAVILTTDHGGTGETHTDPEDHGSYTIPTFLWGPEIPAGVDFYSILANRGDPGDERLDFNAPVQPLRNGDTGNLALALLGLPPVPGSSMIPELSLPSDPIAGDMDASGTVDSADLALFAAYFGTDEGADWSHGDFNGDGRTTLADLAMLQANLTPAGSPVAATSVPEPSGMMLAALACVVIATAARRRA
jgi:hypothetical protein